MASKQQSVGGTRNLQLTRAHKILALVPAQNACSDDSSTSDEEANAYIPPSPDTSDPPSIASSLEALNLLDTSTDSKNEQHDIPITLPLTPTFDEVFPSPNTSNYNVIPTLNSIQSLPSPSVELSSPQPSTSGQQLLLTRSKRKKTTKTVVTKKVKVQKFALNYQWLKAVFRHNVSLEENLYNLHQTQIETVLDYFYFFFSPDLITDIVYNTNLYAVEQLGRSIQLTEDEIKSFLAIQIMMGIVQMPAYTDYWARKTRYPLIADLMPLKKYQQIRRYIHFVDNTLQDSDRYFKIRPLMEKIRKNFLKIEEEGKYSIDEMMIPYKGRKAGKRKQYIKMKPKKWGFKNFVRAGVSGIIYDFILYGGDDTFRGLTFSEKEATIGLGGMVVLALCQTIKKKPAIVYADNFFMSPELTYILREEYGILSLGTIRTNRLRGCQELLPTDKQLKKKKRGSSAQVVCNKNKLAVVKWNDNKVVTLISTYIDSYPLETIKRYDKDEKKKVDVECPQVVKHYNKHMGGVDLADMLISLYRTPFKSHRWYLGIFSQLVDMCINNAWLLHRRDGKKTSLKDFRFELFDGLSKSNRIGTNQNVTDDIGENLKIHKPVSVRPTDSVRFDNTGHLPEAALQGGLDKKQCLAPYKLYPVKVINELTSVLKERKPGAAKGTDEDAEDEEEGDVLIEPLDDSAIGTYFNRIGRTVASVRGRVAQNENYFLDEPNRDNQDAANAVMGIVVEHIEPYIHWKPQLLDAILKYGDRYYTLSLPGASNPPKLKASELQSQFHVTSFNVKVEVEQDVVCGDIRAAGGGGALSLNRGLQKFFETYKYGVLCAKEYCVGIWKGADDKSICLWEPHAVGPGGLASPGGAAALVVMSTTDQVANAFKSTMEKLARPGSNKFCISAVKVFWELSKTPGSVSPQGAVPDEGYEWKVLTAYVETARGRTILRGSRPPDLLRFTRDALLQSACGAVAALCMSHVRRPHLWTRGTVDELMAIAGSLFASSVAALGYEFRPGEDVLLPLQVVKRFVLGVNYVRYDLQQIYSGKLEQKEPTVMTVRCALERFFESHTHGVLWSVPHAVAVWRVAGAPPFYMMEPHACGPTGLRVDAQDDGAACVLTFTSAKLMAFAYLQNIPVTERPKHDFQLYAMSVTVQPIKKLGGVEPPLVRAPPGIKLVPATSKVGIDGSKRRAAEGDRKHPPGSATCIDAQRASEKRDKEEGKLKGQRNTSGWLVLNDGTQFLSAQHSMCCRKFPYASRGHQALACAVMSVAMSRVEDVCRWCSSTLDQILEAGDQLYQDSYLHFKPHGPILNIEQVLRKFYTPGNCVCRVVVYQPRQKGVVDTDLVTQLTEFFREEKCGVLVAGKGDFAVGLFRTPRGFYMFDASDRDRYGRAVAPPCRGRARACFSQYPNVLSLAEKLGSNIPPVMVTTQEDNEKTEGDTANVENEEKEVKFEEPAGFMIFGMEVTSLRRLNRHEK